MRVQCQQQLQIVKPIKKNVEFLNFKINTCVMHYVVFDSSKTRVYCQIDDEYDLLTLVDCIKHLKGLNKLQNQMNKLKKRKPLRWLRGIKKKENDGIIQRAEKTVLNLNNQGYKIGIIASQLNKSLKQVRYIINNQDVDITQQKLLSLNRSLFLWISELLQNQNYNCRKRLIEIYHKFLEIFLLNKNTLSIASFKILLKIRMKISQRLVKQFDRRSSGTKSIQNRFEFTQKYLTPRNIESKIYSYHLNQQFKHLRSYQQITGSPFQKNLINIKMHKASFLTTQHSQVESYRKDLSKFKIHKFFNFLSKQDIQRYCHSQIPYLQKALHKGQI
ncbi:hypothetical protein pb186bvf_001391 [Paramecium bursaria]